MSALPEDSDYLQQFGAEDIKKIETAWFQYRNELEHAPLLRLLRKQVKM